MSVIILLIFFSMIVAGGFMAAFLWAVRSGQYDDNYTPSVRILFDEETAENKKEKTSELKTFKKKDKSSYKQDEILHSVQDEK